MIKFIRTFCLCKLTALGVDVRLAHSDILFAKSNLSLGVAKYHYEVISLSLLNRACVANRTEKPQPSSVEVFLGAEQEMEIEQL